MSNKTQEPSLLDVAQHIRAASDKRQSLAENARTARLSPVCLMSSSLMRLDSSVLHSINQVHLSMYAAMWLNVLGIQRAGAEEILEPLSDRRGADLKDDIMDAGIQVALESAHSEDQTLEPQMPVFLRSEGSFGDQISMESRFDTDIEKPSSLAVGKVIRANLGKDLEDIMINVVLNPRVIENKNLIRVAEAFIGKDQSIIGRWHRWRAGEIKSFKEYALALDIAAEDRQLRLDDPDGFYAAARRARGRGSMMALITGKRSLNIMSNFLMMTKADAADLQGALRGDVSNPRIREELFNTTGTMILTIVDPNREVVTIYTRGQDEGGFYSYEDLEPAAKDPNGANVEAIMKAYKEGAAFTL